MTKIKIVDTKDELFFGDKVKFKELPPQTFFMYKGNLYLKGINKFTGQVNIIDMDTLSIIGSEILFIFDCEEVQPITVLKMKVI